MKLERALFAGAVFFVWLTTASADSGSANNRAAIVKRAKAASAYLFVNTGADREMASAFCVHSSGIFVTCKHVIDAAHGSGQFKLVLKSGEDGERIVGAHVLRTSDDGDLAILKTDEPGPYDALELGDSDTLAETDELIAFGFPFGEGLSATARSNPNITVSSGHVTSLRKLNGELDAIQLDASLNPGNSGGPILDMNGHVVGVVSGGIAGAAINFASPSNKLRALLKTPVVSLSPTTLPYEHRADLISFIVHVDSLLPDPRKLDVTLDLGEPNLPRRFTTVRAPDGTYVTKAVPAPAPDGLMRLGITAQFKSGSVSGETVDRDVNVGRTLLHLRDIRTIDRSSGVCVMASDGRIINGQITGLETVTINLDNSHATLDLSRATKIELRPTDSSPDRVAYRISVYAGAAAVTESSGTIEIIGSSHSDMIATAAPRSSQPTAAPSPEHVDKPNLGLDQVVIRLPGELDDIQPAAGGRLLILHFAGLHQFALFDTAAAKIVRYIPMPAEHILYAAGEHKLVVVRPDDNVIERYDLATCTKELVVASPARTVLTSIGMGWASEGPICFYTNIGCGFLDLQTLRPLDLISKRTENPGYEGGTMRIRGAADGSAFAAWNPDSAPTGVRFLTIEGNRLVCRYAAMTADPLVPSLDGSELFTRDGILKPSQIRENPGNVEGPGGLAMLPTYSPAFYVNVEINGTVRGSSGDMEHRNITIFTSLDHRNLVTLPDVAEPTQEFRRRTMELITPDRRLHVIPDLGLIITVPTTNDRLVLRHFDLLKRLDETGVDYLFAESAPPRAVTKGQDLSYQIVVRSKRGNVAFRMESGPDGMKISPAGLVTWHVPETIGDGPVVVIVSIKDDSGQEIYHNLALTIKAQIVKEVLSGGPATKPVAQTAALAPVIPASDKQVATGGLSKADVLHMLQANRTWYWHWEHKNKNRPFKFTVTPDGRISTSGSSGPDKLTLRWVLFHNGHCLVPINTQKFEGFFVGTGREVGAFTEEKLAALEPENLIDTEGVSRADILQRLQAGRTWYWHWERKNKRLPFKFVIDEDGRIFATNAPKEQDSLELRWVLFHDGHCLVPIDTQTLEGFFIKTGRQADAFTDQKLSP